MNQKNTEHNFNFYIGKKILVKPSANLCRTDCESRTLVIVPLRHTQKSLVFTGDPGQPQGIAPTETDKTTASQGTTRARVSNGDWNPISRIH